MRAFAAAAQLDLDLEPPFGRRFGPNWSVALAGEGLTVESPGRVRIALGCWNRLFGCWVTDLVRGRTREVVPAWSPVEAGAISWPHQGWPAWGPIGRPGALSPRLSFQYRAALTAYIADVPGPLRAVVRRFGPWQWTALDMIWQWPPFATFLDDATFHGRHQYVFAAFSLARARTLRRRERELLARRIAAGPPGEVLSELSGQAWRESTLRILNELGSNPLPRHMYARLAAEAPVASRIPHALKSRLTSLVT